MWGYNTDTSTVASSSKENKKKLNRIKSVKQLNEHSLGMFKTSGQLGNKNDKWKTPFSVLKTNLVFSKTVDKVKSVCTGAVHTVILTSSGVWTMGSNEEGQVKSFFK